MKKAVSILLSVLMVLSFMPLTAFANDSEISSISFAPAEEKVVYEYTGYIVDDPTYGEWWCYNTPTFEEGDELTINFTEGDPEVYTYDTSEEHGYGAFVDGEGNELDYSYSPDTQYTYEQRYDHQLTYGQYRYVIAVYDPVSETQVTCDDYFTFAPNPVTSIELNFAPIVLTEGQNTYSQYDYDAEEYYDCYRFNYYVEGNEIILHTDGDDIVYTCQQVPDKYGGTRLEFADDEGVLMPVEKFFYNDHQDTNHWEGGNTYKVDFTYLNHYTTSFEVTVEKLPYALVVDGYVEGSSMENTGGYYDTMDNYYRYMVPSLCYPGVTLTVRYEDKGDVVYHVDSRYNQTYDYTYYVFVDEDGNDIPQQIYTVDGQDQDHWSVGEHTYHFEVFGLATQDFTYTVTEQPTSFELSGYNGGSAIENTNGEIKTGTDGEYYSYYLPSVCQEGVSMTLHFANQADQTYYAQEYYHDEYGFYSWEFVDGEGNPLGAMPRVLDPQASEPWGVGDHTYYVELGNLQNEYTFTVLEAPYDVVIKGFEENQSFMAIENTDGYWEVDDNEEDFYEYWLPSIWREGVTITLKYKTSDDVTYHTEEVEEVDPESGDVWTHWEFFDEAGDPVDFNIYIQSNQRENHFTIGENTFYVNVGGILKAYTFTVLPAPEKVEFSFAPGTTTTFMENTGGCVDDETGNFIYDLPYIDEEGNTITFYYPEAYGMEPTVFTCQLISDNGSYYHEFVDKDGNVLNDWIRYDVDQSETPLVLGENNVNVLIGDNFSAPVTFTVIGGASSIEFQPAHSFEFYENISGYYDTDANGNEYFYYEYSGRVLNEEGNKLVLHFDDGRDDITYESRFIDHGEWGDIQFVNVDDESDSFFGWNISCSDTQAEEPWGVGIHEVEISYAGCTATFDVEIVESPVESIEFAYANGIPTFAEGEHMTERYPNPEDDPVMVYDLYEAICQPGNTITVNYKDHTSKVYTCDYIPGEESSLWFFDAEGYALEQDALRIIDDQTQSPWQKGTHNFSINYLGEFAEADIVIGEPSPEVLDGWQNLYGKTYYYVNGEPLKGMQTIENNTYIFSKATGEMLYGKQRCDGKWYYLDEETGEMQYGWQSIGDDHYYFNNEDGVMVTGLQEINDDFYYFDENGRQQFGFINIDGKTYYFFDNGDGNMAFGWVMIEDDTYFFDYETGEMLTGIQKIDDGTYYFGEDGVQQTGLIVVNGDTYCFGGPDGTMLCGTWKAFDEGTRYFGEDGKMYKGLQTVGEERYIFAKATGILMYGKVRCDGKWYYMDEETGAMCYGFIDIGDETYFFGDDGTMQTGLVEVKENTFFYFDENGVQQTGFIEIEGGTYYFGGERGEMLFGWQSIDGNKYYFGDDGIMSTGMKTIEGKKYIFSLADGTLLYGKVRLSGKWYYMDETTGEMHFGWKELDGKKYYYGTDGVMVTGMKTIDGKKYIFSLSDGSLLYGRVRLSGKWYYMDETTGEMHFGWKELNGKKYYYGADGVMVTGLQTIDGKRYIFSTSDGSMLTGKVRCAGKWYIMSKATGEMMYGKVRCNGKWYIMSKSTGEMCYGKVRCDGQMYIMSKTTGEMFYGKVTCDGNIYICSKSDGHIFTNMTVTCDGVRYYCDKNGVATKR